MKYYELSDDVHAPGRWHLGEVVSSENIHPDFIRGEPIEWSSTPSLNIVIDQPGIPLSFCLTSFAVPVATAALDSAMRALAGEAIQSIPVKIASDRGFRILNVVRTVECLDETRSRFIRWTANDHRADLAGSYRMVDPLRIDESKIPKGTHIFRVEGWAVALIVSHELRAVMELAGCFGAKFEPVS